MSHVIIISLIAELHIQSEQGIKLCVGQLQLMMQEFLSALWMLQVVSQVIIIVIAELHINWEEGIKILVVDSSW